MDPVYSNKKVLIVEDNEANRYYMGLMFDQVGCHYDLASDGQEAVEKARANKYDVIFMDLRMPVMDGFQATKNIRQDIDKSVLIVAVTANVLDEVVDQCFAAGMNGFIAKGAEVEKFEKEILSWVARSL